MEGQRRDECYVQTVRQTGIKQTNRKEKFIQRPRDGAGKKERNVPKAEGGY